MDYLGKEEIIYINRATLDRHGGLFIPPSNLLHEESLDYLIASVDGTVFGEPMYPTLPDKAALYMFNFISNHVFQDGNKRTGLEAAKLFLRLNGSDLERSIQRVEFEGNILPGDTGSRNERLINFTLGVASGVVSLVACRSWFAINSISVSR